MTMTTNAAEIRNQLAPLYCRYPRQSDPQPAYIELDPEDRTMTADYSSEIGTGVPSAMWHGRILRISISPYITGEQLADLLEDKTFLNLAQRVCDGYECRWDGNNHTGHLTEDAQDALDEMERMTESIEGNLQVWDAGDWITCPEVTAAATDAEIASYAQIIIDDLESNVMIDGGIDALIDYITSYRDRLIEEGKVEWETENPGTDRECHVATIKGQRLEVYAEDDTWCYRWRDGEGREDGDILDADSLDDAKSEALRMI